MSKRLLTAAETAEVLYGDEGKQDRVYAMLREGILPSVRLGRHVRVDSEALDEFIRNGGKAFSGGWRKEA